MLKKLRKKFVLAAMLALALVIGIIICIINLFNYKSVVSQADDTLQFLMDNAGRFPNRNPEIPSPDKDFNFTPETPYESRYFTVTFSDKIIMEVDTSNVAAVDDETAVNMATSVIRLKDRRGFLGSYRYLTAERGDKTRVIFLDCTKSLDNFRTFMILSISISLIGLLAVMILLIIIADRIVKPISDSYEKQRRFITDAGHDIKTPITIIDADAELLEMELGENEWLTDIRKQTSRLALLTRDLIYLSRMDEQETAPHIDFPISDIAEDVAASFCAPARTKNIDLKIDIAPDISYHGDEEAIRKLYTLLLDNAIKYSPEGETVELSLKKVNRSIFIRISNASPDITDETISRMFDRFYRSDEARTSGGFGIGLSVVSAIVSSHKGKFSASKHLDRLIIDIIL